MTLTQKCLILPLIGAILLDSGCASVIKGTHQNVRIATDPVTGANCRVSNSKGIWEVKQTPSIIKVHRDADPLVLVCKKRHYRNSRKEVNSHFNGVTMGNFLLGGPIGAGVDAVDGADYSYPKAINVSMHRRHARA